jgi:O-antigen/teichoic acid export membrane protein
VRPSARAWYGAGEASNAVTLLLFALLARLLGVEPYGELVAIVASTAILGALAEFGFHTLLARTVARDPVRAWTDLRSALARQVWIGPPMLLLLYGYMQWADLSTSSYLAGILVGVSVWCKSLKESLRGVSRGLSRFDLEAVFLWTERLGLLVLSVAAVLLGGGLTAIGAVFLVVRAVDLAAFFVVIRRSLDRSASARAVSLERSRPSHPSVHWLAAWPFAMSNLLFMMYYQVDVTMLAALSTTREAGLYGAVYRFVDALQVIPRLVIVVAFPAMALAWSTDPVRFRRTLHRLQRTLLAIGLPVLLTVFLWSEQLLVLAFGPEFADGSIALRLVVAGNLFAFQSLLLAQAMQTSAHERPLAGILAGTVLFNVVMNATLIPTRGVRGAAEATAMTEALYLLLLAAYALRGSVGILRDPAPARPEPGGAA